MTSTWRSKINAYNIIQRNLIRQIYKYTKKKYIQIHNKECTEISPRDSCFAQWGSSDESRDHCAAKIQHIDIPRQYESHLRQQSKRKHRMVNDVTPFLKHAVIENYKEFCQSQALWGRQSRRACGLIDFKPVGFAFPIALVIGKILCNFLLSHASEKA